MINIHLNKKLHAANGDFNLNFKTEIPKLAFVTLYGKSGAGKTSVLRMLAGLMNPDHGFVTFDDQIWYNSSEKVNLPPQERNIGFVFQDYALFPNMTVQENLSYASSKKTDKSLIHELIEITDLGDLIHRKPLTLSGGQKQRVALARALVQRPKLLLLDEPLSAIDHSLRSELQNYILKLHNAFGLTTILISHDVGEIVKLSTLIIELDHRKPIQQGKPSEVLFRSKLSGKFQFTGEILSVEMQDCVNIYTVLIGMEMVKVVGEHSEEEKLKVGDKVLLASKAFNPIIYKING